MKKLVGEGRPFYSAMDMGAKALKRKVGTGSEFLKELMGLPGVKPTELKERGLEHLMNEPKMTHEEFMANLATRPVPKIREKVFGGDRSEPDSEAPYHNKWTLPGGENYREMLIKAPKGGEEFNGVSGHFGGEPGILASMRLKDRTGPNGEKLLHLEELQSDWHQQGRENGYKDPQAEQKFKQIDDLRRTFFELNKRRRELHEQALQEPDAGPRFNGLMEEANGITPKLLELNSQIHDLEHLKKQQQDAIPDAPFKKNWEEMAIKRLIHHAAEKGYHGIVMTPGAEQADRYSLAKHIDSIMLVPNPHPNKETHPYYFKAFDKEGNRVADDTVNDEKLQQYIGKEPAQQLLSTKPNPMGERMISGANIVSGGEGMKGFYDKKVPNIFNAVGKKHGVQMKLHSHPIETEPRQKFGNDSFSFGAPAKTANMHHFPITEPMRQDVLKNGLPLYNTGGVIHKAEGGNVQPSVEQMRMALQNKGTYPKYGIQSIGANEAPDMSPKYYVEPDKNGSPSVGGVDMNKLMPGMQLVQQDAQAMQPPQGIPQGGNNSSPLGAPPSNILQMTPQGQALGAMSPPQQLQPQGLAKGGSAKSVEEMKSELSSKKAEKSKRVQIKAEGSGGVKGIVVPRHLIEGNPKANAEGLKKMMNARAKVYGPEHREPLNLGQIGRIHKDTLNQHFAKPREEQLHEEQSALNRIRSAKFIKHNRDTLDESEKLDTVHHEHDAQGRSHVGYASKGVAGHALFPQGHGKDMDYKVINTCPGQTEGCGGGTDAKGVVDTSKGTCFAPNAESQYAAAASRRAGHEIAKHDPKMTQDWILAHTGSIRNASDKADKQNKRMLFRPNVVDETDVSSRHVIRHLNEQRKAEGKPPIIANSYGKTNELHDPENGYHVTHSNVGPKTKHGSSIAENISRDKARIRNTITATDNKGDFTNEQGHKTPPKGSYMVTDVRRGSPMSKNMENAITHAKYWSTGRTEGELTKEEKEEGPEGHFNGTGHPTTEDKAHYGHKTVKDLRFDYQKQHILHPRLVQVGKNDDGTPHMIPTDSRFKDEEFLPKNRFKTKNGKNAGHILMTTPTESTSNLGHQTSFTHHVGEGDIQHAKKNKGEYVIDRPEDQIKSQGKEYSAPQPINIIRKADGGLIGGRHEGYSDDDFHAFPEQNPIAQRHLAMRRGEDESMPYHSPKHKVTIHNNMDTMLLELMRKK